MGERIQVFLIARTANRRRKYRYQCVGAFHHEWCYGVLPLRALYRFFALLQVRENAAVVRDELRGLCAWNTGSSGSPEPWRNPAIPCPFTVSLLSAAWTTDLHHQTYLSNYSFGNGLIDSTKHCWHRASLNQNDVGICVIDITDISSPEYCFVRKPGLPVLSAYGFLSQDRPSEFETESVDFTAEYRHNGRETIYFIDALKAFWGLVDLAGYPIIPAHTLRKIWPGAAADREGPKQTEIPVLDDLPMPLDIVVSLWLGFSDSAVLATITRVFGVEEPHHAIGKAILPPYEGTPEDIWRRTRVIQSLLSKQRAFEYVLTPRRRSSSNLCPAYMPESVTVDQLSLWYSEYVSSAGSRVPEGDFTSTGRQEWVSQPLFQPLIDILHPAYVMKLTLSAMNPFPDGLLDALWFALQELGETTFIDLSCTHLSRNQVINILNRSTEVQALSLSGNPNIQPFDLLRIISSAPSLRRLHVMHMLELRVQPTLRTLLGTLPAAFRQLEGLMNPQLLACCHTADWWATFTFRHETRTTVEGSHHVSIPLFTPAQVVQALTHILPLAFLENGYGESTSLLRHNVQLALQTGANNYAVPAEGFPFNLTSPMLLHVALSCGALCPGQTWSARPVVNVPSDSFWDMPEAEGWGSWVFHFDWDHRRHRNDVPGRNQWGFILYQVISATEAGDSYPTTPRTRSGDSTSDSDFPDIEAAQAGRAAGGAPAFHAHTPAISDTGPMDAQTPFQPENGASPLRKLGLSAGRVYDLRGFLRCMAAEGRPLPDAEAVERLERILNMRDATTGSLICELMSQDDVPRMMNIKLPEEERKGVYAKKYGGLTSNRWATLYPGRFLGDVTKLKTNEWFSGTL